MPRDRSKSVEREHRRERDRSRSRDRDGRSSRRRSRSRSRDRSDRRQTDRSGRDDDRGKARDKDAWDGRERDREPSRSSVSTSQVSQGVARSTQSSRADAEATRKERLELVQRIIKDDTQAVKPVKNAILQSLGVKVSDTNEEDEEVDDEEAMMRAMGFGGFDSTKGKPVVDNATSAAAGGAMKNKKRVYRQYMNRRGGFNKPLAKTA